jgi:hypothetical protein
VQPGPTELPDSDPTPEAGEGQLGSFGLFTPRDPFVQLVDASAGSSDSDGSGGGGSGSGTGSGGSGGGGTSASDPSTAHFTINSKSEDVNKGSAFPASDPTFTLVAVSPDSVTIGLVQGLFEDGSSTQDIAVGEQVTLIAAPDTTQWKIKLVSVS